MSILEESTLLPSQEEGRTAHLYEAHVGDIKGVWGTIRRGDTAPCKN